jgi:cytochrome b subunit of formate dehydrogenase
MSENRRYLRFPLSHRIEHWVLFVSFTTLALTGLVQKFATLGISQAIIGLLGGVETVRIIHRIAAALMMVEAVYHLGTLTYRLFVLRVSPSILPGKSDFVAFWHELLHILGFRKRKAQQGRYTFAEKAEYWFLIWGTLVMGITGFILWNPIATSKLLPGQVIPAAKAAHGGEALLAVLAIAVWHMYHVHIRSFNKSMFTGYLSEEEMLDEHPLELADLKAGIGQAPIDAKILRRRNLIFFPVYGVLSIAMLYGIYCFATFEETAITTVPPAEQVEVFVPLTPTPPSTDTPSAQGATSWEQGIADLLGAKCGLCHAGDTLLGGLDIGSYETALAGGVSGLAIDPGSPDTSLLITRQITGDHPGMLSSEELAAVRQWIEAGAPEQ